MEPKEIKIKASSKKSLILQYKLQLALPSYCSSNWDSFEECLLDHLEDNNRPLVIVHDGGIDLDDEEREVYLSILDNAKRSHDVRIVQDIV